MRRRITTDEVRGVWEIDDLNCHDAHVRELRNGQPGELRYGWAVAPDGNRYQHCWIRKPDGDILDLFEWTSHEDLGRRYVDDVVRSNDQGQEEP